MQCTDCRGSLFVWTRDGDVVCKGCGLVAQERYIDDSPEWRNYDDGEDHSRVAPVFLQQKKRKVTIPIEDVVLQDLANEYMQLFPERFRETTMTAVCVYKASRALARGWTVDQAMNMFQVSSKDFWTYYDYINKESKDTTSAYDQLATCKRMIYSLADIDHVKVINASRQLLERVGDFPGGIKASKLCVTIVHVACKISGSDLSDEICDIFNTTKRTLMKHEAYIQQRLMIK